MKRLFLMLAMLLCSVGVTAQEGGATIKMNTLNHDFGIMKLGSAPRSFEFEFVNSGNKPLVITRVTTTCTCIKIDSPRKPVAPSEKGVIKITYDPKKDLGVFNKGIQIYSNSTTGRLIVSVKGEVVE